MLDYNLTKRLEDAGFPLTPNRWDYAGLGFVYCPKCKKTLGSGDNTATVGSACKGCGTTDGDFLIPPTLEELIEACLSFFPIDKDETKLVIETDYRVNYSLDSEEDLGKYRWRARIKKEEKKHKCNCENCDQMEVDDVYINSNGDTLAEAVANLWLKLNEK